MRELLSIPIISNLAGSGFALSFLTTGFEVLFALYSYTAIENGGLGFPVSLNMLLFHHILNYAAHQNWLRTFCIRDTLGVPSSALHAMALAHI